MLESKTPHPTNSSIFVPLKLVKQLHHFGRLPGYGDLRQRHLLHLASSSTDCLFSQCFRRPDYSHGGGGRRAGTGCRFRRGLGRRRRGMSRFGCLHEYQVIREHPNSGTFNDRFAYFGFVNFAVFILILSISFYYKLSVKDHNWIRAAPLLSQRSLAGRRW